MIFFLTNIHVPLNLPSEIMIIFCVHHIHNTYDDYADDVDRKNGNDDNDENDEQCIQTMDSLRSAATSSRTHAIVRRFILIIIGLDLVIISGTMPCSWRRYEIMILLR